MKRIIFLSLFLAGCATGPSPEFERGDAEVAINRHNERMERAAAAGNVEEMISIYDEEAVLMPPNGPAITGMAGIRRYWGGMLSAGRIQFDIMTDEVLQSEDLAAERGRYEVTITPPGGAPIRDTGKYVVIWRKIDGRWKNVTDIFNSDSPARPSLQ